MDFDLAVVLTTAGAVVSAGLIATFIQTIKRVIKTIDADGETNLSMALAAVLVGYAAWATGYQVDPISAFALFLSWLGIVLVSDKAHELTPQPVRDALSGKGQG